MGSIKVYSNEIFVGAKVPHPLLSGRVVFDKISVKLSRSSMLSESVTLLIAESPKFNTAVKTPVAAPPKSVAMSVFPSTKSFPPSKI